jgi:hypothetical protein
VEFNLKSIPQDFPILRCLFLNFSLLKYNFMEIQVEQNSYLNFDGRHGQYFKVKLTNYIFLYLKASIFLNSAAFL